jgi:hypothetical protein
MAGLAGMDSPYPETGVVEISTFDENTAKIASTVRMTEAVMRQLQQMMMQLQLSGQPTNEVMAREALNFLDKVIVQGHLDTAEWLRGQALCTGMIDWTFNGKRLQVDYGIPTANKLTARTGNDGYGGSASKFWTDVRAIRRILKDVRGILVHPDTLDMIRYNPANNLVAVSEVNGAVTFRKVNGQGQFTQDTGDSVTLISYGLEGEVEDPANAGKSLKVPFMLRGTMVGLGNNTTNGYQVGAAVGQGSTPAPQNTLGYTHLAPTVEGGGRPGRWADLYTPQNEPWQLVARGAQNIMPVVEAPEKIVIGKSDMA